MQPFNPRMVLAIAAGVLHRGEERFLVREVFEKERFRDTCRRSQLAGRRAVKAFLREDAANRRV